MATASNPDSTAMWGLLRGVSRSFYLSIRLLPKGMREPVAVGYLLARATDTVADTTSISVGQRADQLRWLSNLIAIPATDRRGDASALAATFAPAQQHKDEQALILALPACLAWLDSLQTADQANVREVLRHITRGQLVDVERFGGATAANPCRLASSSELDEYTYLVAGSVGEFWTQVAYRHEPACSSAPLDRMLEWSRSYGMGLQLVNILRDTNEDRANGRIYLPAELPDPRLWLGRAIKGLDDGMRYAAALRMRRLRVASALPALLGARTLALVQAAGNGAGTGTGMRGGAVGIAGTATKVKMPRSEVRRVLLRSALSFGSVASLEAQYARLKRAPIAGWDNPAP